MPFCKDCRHIRPLREGGKIDTNAICSHPKVIVPKEDTVTGKKTTRKGALARYVRIGECGPQAELFEALES